MSNATPRPVTTLRDSGGLKATIWKNDSKNGTFYSVEFSRTYKQGDVYKDSHSFSGTELLQLARLAHIAYDEIAELRQQDRNQEQAA